MRPVHWMEPKSVASDFESDAMLGLLSERKRISPKYLYDQKGSELFEQICELPEYYPTRTEIEILKAEGDKIAQALVSPLQSPDVGLVIIEPGSGSSQKIHYLLNPLRRMQGPCSFVPIDISGSALFEGAKKIAALYPQVAVLPLMGDYTKGFSSVSKFLPRSGLRVIFFPGTTIGNFEPWEAERFLSECAELVGTQGALILGFDQVKPPKLLEAAYDDSSGVTAAFNLNLLERMNRELGADFDVSRFRHRAIYDPVLKRVEMHLLSIEDQKVRIQDRRIHFRAGESIHTESSHKYTVDSMRALAARGGFRLEEAWMDSNRHFSVALFRRMGVQKETRPSLV